MPQFVQTAVFSVPPCSSQVNKSYLKEKQDTVVGMCDERNVGFVVRTSIFVLYAGTVYHRSRRFKPKRECLPRRLRGVKNVGRMK